jgi:O-antigen/teichoic acid export membrane protein
MKRKRNPNKYKAVIDVILKHWRTTFGAVIVLISTFSLIFKFVSIEVYAAIISAMVAAGYLPKQKDDEATG